MELSYQQKCTLRDLGWTLTPRKGQGPRAVSVGNVLRVGEDVVFENEAADEEIVDLATRL